MVASAFHEDPRYFRMGEGHSLKYRAGYAISRALVIRNHNSRNTFNFDNVLGSAMSAGFSNLYYPAASRTGSATLMHLLIEIADNGFVNLAPEFWPDFRRKVLRRKQRRVLQTNVVDRRWLIARNKVWSARNSQFWQSALLPFHCRWRRPDCPKRIRQPCSISNGRAFMARLTHVLKPAPLSLSQMRTGRRISIFRNIRRNTTLVAGYWLAAPVTLMDHNG